MLVRYFQNESGVYQPHGNAEHDLTPSVDKDNSVKEVRELVSLKNGVLLL